MSKRSSPIGVASAWHSPTPGTSSRSVSPRRTLSITWEGMSPGSNPLAITTPSVPTIAPTSAANASVARSIASRAAPWTSSAAETAARNSVSC